MTGNTCLNCEHWRIKRTINCSWGLCTILSEAVDVSKNSNLGLIEIKVESSVEAKLRVSTRDIFSCAAFKLRQGNLKAEGGIFIPQ